jgi:hypothetical protein
LNRWFYHIVEVVDTITHRPHALLPGAHHTYPNRDDAQQIPLVYETLLSQFRKRHAQLRLGALTLLRDLLPRCGALRRLALEHFREIISLCTGINGEELPPPKRFASKLQPLALSCVLEWKNKFPTITTITLAWEQLRTTLKVCFCLHMRLVCWSCCALRLSDLRCVARPDFVLDDIAGDLAPSFPIHSSKEETDQILAAQKKQQREQDRQVRELAGETFVCKCVRTSRVRACGCVRVCVRACVRVV